MKLVFRKDDEMDISVLQKTDDQELDFSYVMMIKSLIRTKKLEAPIVEGSFSDAEKESINSMVTLINEELESLNKEWEEEQ